MYKNYIITKVRIKKKKKKKNDVLLIIAATMHNVSKLSSDSENYRSSSVAAVEFYLVFVVILAGGRGSVHLMRQYIRFQQRHLVRQWHTWIQGWGGFNP